MNFKVKNIALLAALAAAFLAVSCKKDENKTVPSLDGYLEYSSPIYVKPGDVLTLVPKGGSHPKEDGQYGILWRTSPKTVMEKTDTTKHLKDDPAKNDGRLVLTIPDLMSTFTLTCVMFAEGYTSLYASNQICIVKEESVSNIPAAEGEKTITDPRDDVSYTYVTAGGLDWMNGNVEYASVGMPYEGCSPMTGLFGNLYTYEQAETVCPEGWRLPTMDEWKAVCGGDFKGAAGKLMVDAYFNGNKMWEYWPSVKITNATGLNVIPAGYAIVQGDNWRYAGTNEYATFWTSSDYDEEQKYMVSVYVDQPDVIVGSSHVDNFGASVRCVRETE